MTFINMELRGNSGQILRGCFEVERAAKLLELFLECERLFEESKTQEIIKAVSKDLPKLD